MRALISPTGAAGMGATVTASDASDPIFRSAAIWNSGDLVILLGLHTPSGPQSERPPAMLALRRADARDRVATPPAKADYIDRQIDPRTGGAPIVGRRKLVRSAWCLTCCVAGL